MKIIAISLQKGGAGKTTTAAQLGQALARKGRQVLLIDADPQANLSLVLTGTRKHARGLGEVLRDEVPLQDVLQVLPSGVTMCPSTRLEGIDLKLEGDPARLRRALEAAPLEGYELVIIDTPPQVGMLAVNALVAAHAVLTPVLPALLSLDAVQQLARTIERARTHNPGLAVLGYLLVQVNNRKKITEEARERLRDYAKGTRSALWRSEIRVDTMLEVAPASIRRTRAVLDYEAAARELLRRLRQLDQVEG